MLREMLNPFVARIWPHVRRFCLRYSIIDRLLPCSPARNFVLPFFGDKLKLDFEKIKLGMPTDEVRRLMHEYQEEKVEWYRHHPMWLTGLYIYRNSNSWPPLSTRALVCVDEWGRVQWKRLREPPWKDELKWYLGEFKRKLFGAST